MLQEQKKEVEGGKCRKEVESCIYFLGHAIKSCMTVINFDGELSVM